MFKILLATGRWSGGAMYPSGRAMKADTSHRFALIRPFASISIAAALILTPLEAAPGSQDMRHVPRLREGGTVYLENDMQASRESPTVFREFRREMRKIDQFEAVDSYDEADFIVILSGDPDVLGRGEIKNQGLAYPNGYSSTKPMILLIYDAKTLLLLWFDAEPWQTVGNTGGRLSHVGLVKRLAAAIEEEEQAP